RGDGRVPCGPPPGDPEHLPTREGSPRRAHYRGRAHLNGLALSLFPPAPFTKCGGQRSVAERNPPHIRPDGPGAAPRTTSTRRGVLPVPQRREEEPLDLPGRERPCEEVSLGEVAPLLVQRPELVDVLD